MEVVSAHGRDEAGWALKFSSIPSQSLIPWLFLELEILLSESQCCGCGGWAVTPLWETRNMRV